jgi:hypothetical protein
MAKKKNYIIIDPFKDKTMYHIFTDLQNEQIVPFNYNKKVQEWQNVSRKIGKRCKKLINDENPEDGFLYPTSTSRWHKVGFVGRPKKSKVSIIPHGKKKKVVFNRRIF